MSFVDDILTNMVQMGANVTLIHPAPIGGPNGHILNLSGGRETLGLRIPTGLYPLIIEQIKVLVGADPNIIGQPYIGRHARLMPTASKMCLFEINIEPTTRTDNLEQVHIRRLE